MGNAHLVGHLRGVAVTAVPDESSGATLLIAFDLDGTIVDSRRDLADSANAVIEEMGGAPLAVDTIGRMVGEGAAVLVQRALHAVSLPYTAGALERFMEVYDERLLNHTRPYPAMVDVVRAARRCARVALLTNKPRQPSVRILEAFGLLDCFDEIRGGDGPHARKPDPGALLGLMETAGVSPDQTWMVGDSAVDHQTAQRAGARCCLAGFGFGFETFPMERLTGRDWVATTPEALRVYIERLPQPPG